jgi:diguanylate cyclase (GGDEF)-like protein
MKLNRRSVILILPALSAGYFLAFLGVYFTQKDMILEAETNNAQMHASELSDTVSHYASLARNYLYTFIQTQSFSHLLKLDSEDYRALAVDGSLSDAVRSMGILPQDHITVAVLRKGGELQYFYEDSLDPFSVLDDRYRHQVAAMFSEGRVSDSKFYYGDQPVLTFARIIDRRTLNEPVDIHSPDSIAVIVALKAHKFKIRQYALTASGKQVTWQDPDLVSSPHPLRIQAHEHLPQFGRISVIVPGTQIAQKLTEIKSALALALVLLGVLSGLLLSYLIWRFITRPIHQLERDLSAIDHDTKGTLEVYNSQDEIGSLSKTFAKMYEDLHKSYQISREMAERDGLTRLYNRRMFHYHMDQLLQRAKDSGGKVALLYIDVDNFKFINDTYGHGVGDELLRTFADRLGEVLRPGDLIQPDGPEQAGHSQDCTARLAGDEFAVLLYGFEDNDVPRRVAARILGICDGDSLTDSVRFCTSLSVGVACYPNDASNATELISNADTAMYQAKNNGKNRYSFYSEELASQSRRVAEIEAQLKQLDFDEFDLHYMPIVDAHSHQIVAVEALVRWHSKTLGTVSPAEFIPIAESIGAFRAIDRWVIFRSRRDLPALQGALGNQLKVSVNVSAAELESREFLNEIATLVEQGRIEPEHFEFEITETFHINNRVDSEDILRCLGALGFSISIDDFGTGFTSLIQLVEYPINKIKLDKSFLEKVIERDRTTILCSLVEFCKSQNFSITAEGVETMEQVDILRQAGCDYLQGYHFYKPAPLDALIVEIALGAQRPADVTPLDTGSVTQTQTSAVELFHSA